jgi:hypothetical protein
MTYRSLFQHLLLVLPLAAGNAWADLASSHDSFIGPYTVTHDSKTDLEWLDLDLTLGMSWNEAEDTFASRGFRHATEAEVGQLFTNAGLIEGENDSESNYAAARKFQDLTACQTIINKPEQQNTCQSAGPAFIRSIADATFVRMMAIVRDDKSSSALVVGENDGLEIIALPEWLEDGGRPDMAHWLVRDLPGGPGNLAEIEIDQFAGLELLYGVPDDRSLAEYDLGMEFDAIESAFLEITMSGHIGQFEICSTTCSIKDFLSLLIYFPSEGPGTGSAVDSIHVTDEASTVYTLNLREIRGIRPALGFLLDGKGRLSLGHNILIGPGDGSIRIIDRPSLLLEKVKLTVTGTAKNIPISIDLDPKHTPSQVRIKGLDENDQPGVKVVVLSDTNFDAGQIDATTIEFGHLRANPSSSNLKDIDRDGDVDLELQFRNPGIGCTDTIVHLSARTFAGDRVTGSDNIQVTGKSCN